MLLCEIRSTVPYSWTEQLSDFYSADFMVGDNFYCTRFILISPHNKEPFWVVEFQLLNGKTIDADGNVGYGDEDVGSSTTVFGVVLKLVDQWVTKANPKYFKFEAKTPKRTELYSRIIKTLKHPNWQVKTKRIGKSTSFEVRVKDQSKRRFGFF